jgi:hypothetical protein
MTKLEQEFPTNLPPEMWQKVIVILMKKYGMREARITEEDIKELNAGGKYPVLGTHFHKNNALTVILFDDIKDAEAYTLAHPEGRRVI